MAHRVHTSPHRKCSNRRGRAVAIVRRKLERNAQGEISVALPQSLYNYSTGDENDSR